MNKVIDKIKEIRIAKGFSHENMAYELEISQAAYTKLENNETKLSVERLFQIAKILDTPVYKLLDTTPDTVYNQNNYDSATGNHQYVEHLYQDNKEVYQDYINNLKQEINYLKEQNLKLMDMLCSN